MDDLAVVGLGAAGAALAWRLAGAGSPFSVLEAPADAAQRSPERTWCTWGASGPGPFQRLVAHEWRHLAVVAPDGSRTVADLGAWRYRMLTSTAVDAAVRARLAAHGVPVREEVVDDLDALLARARRVVDTRPVPVPAGGRTLLFQHFVGWRVRTAGPRFDPGTATLMDFRVPQPAGGVAFGYVLPDAADSALVEHTVFSRHPLGRDEHVARLEEYLRRSGTGRVEVLAEEAGAIPMTDAAFPPDPRPRVLRFGAGGGSVRPSTGYSFTTLQRQADVLAGRLLRAGATTAVDVPRPHARRHLLMDSVVLDALASGGIDGAEFFVRLFRRNPVHRVLGFLDGSTGPAADVALMAPSPRGPMLRALARRLRPVGGPAGG